jgi:acetylglutamate kinase
MIDNNKVSQALIDSLPYLRKFKQETIVVKIGGAALFKENSKESLIADLCYLITVGIRVVVVHGGGKDADQLSKALGREPRFVEGLRYTSPEDAEIVEMVFSGKLNKALVALCTTHGVKAVGLSGKDAGFIEIEPRSSSKGEDLGQVGRITKVNVGILNHLLDGGYLPIISPIASLDGHSTYNINADEVAASVASAMKCGKLIFMSDVDGLMLDDKLISEMDLKEIENLAGDSRVSGGMLPKLQFTTEALRSGVRDVHFINGSLPHSMLLELFTDKGVGSKFTYSRRKRD